MNSAQLQPAGAATALAPTILIRGAGEMASAIAVRLYRANFRQICMVDLENPLCVRRLVSFCPALLDGTATVEGVVAGKARTFSEVNALWQDQQIAVMLASDWQQARAPRPDIVVDAILAKKNLGTGRHDGDLVIALGPGFEAGIDCHQVIETNRGHDLGRIMDSGTAHPNTGIPGAISGETARRILRAPCDGVFHGHTEIGAFLHKGEIAGYVGDQPVRAEIDGMIRGLIRTRTEVTSGLKLGDIDPRGDKSYCTTISDKARAISGSVLECAMRHVTRASA